MSRKIAPAFLLLVALLLISAPSVQHVYAQDDPSPTAGDRILFPIVAGPTIFAEPWPANDAQRQSLNAYLTWRIVSPEWANATFSVLLAPDDPTPDTLLAVGLPKAAYDPYTFAEDTIYYWQVVAELPDGRRAASPIWHFRTDYFPDTPELGSMVYVPEGEFQMGCDPLNSGFECFGEQLPLHKVWLSAFSMDKYEITNGEYRQCVNAGACRMPRRDSIEGKPYFSVPLYGDYPVLYVSHWDAENYCGWVGKRLPTEAEWEKAARGAIDTRPWPWGSEPWDCSRMNRCRDSEDWFPARVDDSHRGQSPYGVLNLAGNAAEWVQDYYLPEYYGKSPYKDPMNSEEWNPGYGRKYFSIRGGSFHDDWYYARTSHRKYGHWGDEPGGDKPLYRSFRVTIRCARDGAP